LLEGFNGIVVIDEAYIDFSSERSWVTELANYPNLVVLQTLSKAWGLANLRIGMLFASPELVKVLNKLKLPYNISGVAQEYALQALRGHVEQKEQMVQEILHQRSKLLEEFASVPCITRVYPTDANFVLVKTIDPNAIYKFLIDKKIVVRNRNNVVLCEGCLRITVGTEAENRELLEALREYK
jgi:histidinol-phosphate aminotransferase